MAEIYFKDLFPTVSSVYISQDHLCTFSHDLTGAVDYIQKSKICTPVYAPCKLKLKYSEQIKPNDGLSATNTLLFESVSPINFTDGSTDILSIGFAHMRDAQYDSLDVASWPSGKTFEKGDLIYYEGDKGVDPEAIHVHIRVAKGVFRTGQSAWKVVRTDPKRVVLNTTGETPLTHDKVFYTENISFTYNAKIYESNEPYSSPSSFAWKQSPTGGSSDLVGVYLVAKNYPFNIRETVGTGTVKITVPQGSEAQILEFGSEFITASDGKKYQWAKTKYNNVIGYSQLDLHNDYLIRKESTSSKIYLRAVVGGFRVRNAPVVGNELTFVPQNDKAEILYTNVVFESDGFQWPRVTYNGTSGFSQMDTVGYYRLEK